MYQLVNDIEAYPEFLPWCGGARILHADDENLEASILIQKAGFNQWFTTRNRMNAGRSIEMSLVDGPFRRLEGSWQFSQLADEGCKIRFDLEFETKRGIAAAIIGPAFAQIANSLVDAFCARAEEINGR